MRNAMVDSRNRSRRLRRARRGPLRIALAVPHGRPFVERLLGGVIEYARAHGNWTFARIAEARVHSTLWLRNWDGDGAIVWVDDRAEETTLRAMPFPVVNIASNIGDLRIPSVITDHRAIGRLAAAHLAERRFLRCAYVGVKNQWYSSEREAGFVEEIDRRGGTCAVHRAPIPRSAAIGWREEQGKLDDWLRHLQRPVGIFVCSDPRAAMVLDACARLGLQVPDEVAVLGVDDAVLTCESCVPTLSSVSRNDREVGLAAAALLGRLIAGDGPPSGPQLMPPGSVTLRASTDTRAVEDPVVAGALRWIDQHVGRPFGVAALVEQLGRSRRTVEGLFQAALGCSPYHAICQQRVAHARRLLVAPGPLPLKSVAAACGFANARRLGLVFRRIAGLSPKEYRTQQARSAMQAG